MIPDFDSIFHLVKDPIRQTVTRPQPHESASFLSSYSRIPVYTIPEMEPVKYLSRARRIEASMLPAMCFEVVKQMKTLTLYDQERLKNEFVTAIEQMLLGETKDRAEDLANSITRQGLEVIHGHLGGYFWAPLNWHKIGIVLYSLACDLTADGTFELVEGSTMHRSLEEMRNASLKELHPKQIESAEDQALKFRRFLSERGYFR